MVKKSGYKYILGGIILLLLIGAGIGFLLPFYTANFNGYYGDYQLIGTVSITGIAMVFGLSASVSGEFVNKTYTTIPQIPTILIFVLLCAAFLLALIALCFKNKDSFPYAFLNAGVGILSLFATLFTFLNHLITGISLSSETPGFRSESLGYGAIISGFSFGIIAILEVILVFVTMFVLSHQHHEAGDFVDPSGELEYKYASKDHYVGYNDPAKDRRYQIEEQKVEEVKKPSSHLHSSIDIFASEEPVKKESVDPFKNADPSLSFQEKLDTLKKMHQNGQLSDDDYTKFRDRLISEYIDNGGK